MPSAVSLSAVPRTLDEDELPFVFGVGPDPRRALVTPDAQYRRADDRCSIEYLYGGESLRLRAVVLSGGDVCYITACLGPLLNEWWPLLKRSSADPRRPILSAGAAQRPVTVRSGDMPLEVHLVGPSQTVPMTLAMVGFEEPMNDGVLAIGHAVGLGVVKVALRALCEYRTLVRHVPDMDVNTTGRAVPLETLLDAAEEAADAIDWQILAS